MSAAMIAVIIKPICVMAFIHLKTKFNLTKE